MITMGTQPQRSPAQVGPSAATCAVILVCWNNKAYLEPCLRSLFDAGLHNSCEVVVVDNGSTDGSQEMLRTQFPQVQIVQNDSNVGLGKASNQGIEVTTAPYVLLLNNDTLVNGGSLDAMLDFMDATPDAGAVGGTLLNPDGSFQSGYNNFSSLLEEFLIATRLGDLVRAGYPSHRGGEFVRSVGWITSACLLVRRTALVEVGLLDEEYFIYGDEADLQYRLIRAGWRIYYLPNATTIHFGGRSMDRWRRRRMVYRGKMLFYKKNYGTLRQFMLRTMLAGLTAVKVAAWGLVWPVPSMRNRATRELASNAAVLRLCLKLE
jgi:N-acetylglucosaminyl-diphospho-decaprenol L-rhamnosyltransferase